MSIILLENKLLQVAAEKIESHLTPETRADYSKIIAAGTKTPPYRGPNGLYRKPNGCLACLKDSENPISQCVSDAINLCLLMRARNHAMPVQALVPAAMTLTLKALDFAEKIGVVKIGNDELVQATHLFTNLIFQRFGITAQMLHTAAAKVHALTQDPAAMQKVNARAGLIKAPNANAASNANAAVKTPIPAPMASAGGSNGAS